MPLLPPVAGPNRDSPPRIPATANICIALAACVIAVILLRGASVSESWLVTMSCALAFSLVANTIFSCLHECVHGTFHPDSRINYAFGVLTAAMFPTGFSLQRAAHLGHHQRNRSSAEMFDYYQPQDSRILKALQWYGIISGIYWIVAVLGWLLYLLLPFAFGGAAASIRWNEQAEHTSGPAYLRSFASAPPVRARIELLLTIAVQAALAVACDFSLAGWLACYLAFALQWSALQYADHAFSPLHPVEGAWDLRVHPWIQAIFLNYHLHLAHHRHPSVPWLYLPRHVDPLRVRPSFLRQYARMWLGPRPMPAREET